MSQSVNKTSVARTTRRSERGSTEAVFVSPQCQRNCPEKGQQSKGSEMGRITEGASLSVMSGGDLVDVRLRELLLLAIRHPLGTTNALS